MTHCHIAVVCPQPATNCNASSGSLVASEPSRPLLLLPELFMRARTLPLPCSGNPLLSQPHAAVLGEPSSMQCCLAVNIWLAAAVGVVLPLFVLGRWEAAGRCSLYARRWRQAQQAQQAGDVSSAAVADLERLCKRDAVWPWPLGWADACICLYLLWLALALLLHAGML